MGFGGADGFHAGSGGGGGGTLTGADNGLSVSGTTVQLGGALIQPTVITSSGANTLSINNDYGVVSFGVSESLYTKGIDNTIANYAFKADDFVGNPLLYIANSAKVSIGKVISTTTLDVQGDTVNPLFKLNNSNFLFADKLRVDNVGSFYSGSINGFGAFGTGTYTTDHLDYTFRTSYSTFLAFTNAGGAGNRSSYGIIGGPIGSADWDYRLVVLNNDATTLGSVLKVVSTTAALVNDGFDYFNYGINIINNGVLNNIGAGTFYKIGLNVNVSNADVNYAALFNGGNSGFGITNPLAQVHIKGIDSTTNANVRLEPVTNVTEDTTGNTVNTIDNTTVALETLAIPTDTVVMIESRVTCRKTGGAGAGALGEGNGYIRTVKAENIGGVVNIGVIQSSFTSESIGVFNATFAVSGTNVVLNVTGANNDNVTWNSITRKYKVA